MAVSHEPVFAQGGRTVCATATAAKTTYNDAANAVKLCDAGTNGSLLKALSAMPLATVTASKLMLFVSPDNGVTMYLVSSALMAAHTLAVTTATATTYFTDFSEGSPLRLPSSWSAWIASGVALAGGIVFTGQVEYF